MWNRQNSLLRGAMLAGALVTALSVRASADVWAPIPYTPYGMDAVPATQFSPRYWDHYGSDPVPAGTTSDFGFRDVYGLDAIPEGTVLLVKNQIRQVFPHHLIQVLTGAESEGATVKPKPKPAARKSR